MREIKEGQLYKHFKGNIYIVLYIAQHTETNEQFVIYRRYYEDQKTFDDNKIWARPYDMFNSKVDKEKYPDVKQEYRFELIEE